MRRLFIAAGLLLAVGSAWADGTTLIDAVTYAQARGTQCLVGMRMAHCICWLGTEGEQHWVRSLDQSDLLQLSTGQYIWTADAAGDLLSPNYPLPMQEGDGRYVFLKEKDALLLVVHAKKFPACPN